jgi:Tfp pilus assembly protein PilF
LAESGEGLIPPDITRRRVLIVTRLEKIKEMLEADPMDVFLVFGLAMEYAKTGDHQQASQYFERALQINPEYIPAYFQQANMYLSTGEPDKARELLEKGIAVANRIGDSHAAGEMTELLHTL